MKHLILSTRITPGILSRFRIQALGFTCAFVCLSVRVSAVDYTWDGTINDWNSMHWFDGASLVTFPAGNSNANTATIYSGLVGFNQNDTFGNASTPSTPVITINAGGTLASTVNVADGRWFNAIWNLNLNGGTLLANGGANGGGYGAFALKGTVTVGGNVPSNISVGGGSFNTVSLGAGGECGHLQCRGCHGEQRRRSHHFGGP